MCVIPDSVLLLGAAYPDAAAGPHDAAHVFDDFSLAGPYHWKPRTDALCGLHRILVGDPHQSELPFDHVTQACLALKEGVRVILVNSNSLTIMTDDVADKVYIEPITLSSSLQFCVGSARRHRPLPELASLIWPLSG